MPQPAHAARERRDTGVACCVGGTAYRPVDTPRRRDCVCIIPTERRKTSGGGGGSVKDAIAATGGSGTGARPS